VTENKRENGQQRKQKNINILKMSEYFVVAAASAIIAAAAVNKKAILSQR